MKLLSIFICCTLFVPTAAIAGVSNIKYMNRSYNDNFDVTCLNGALETVNSKAILENSVCKTVADQSFSTNKYFSKNKSVVCTGSSAWFYVTRISDGKRLGESLSLKECQQAVKASSKSVVCTGSSVWFYVTRISDGRKIGDSLPLEKCQQTTRTSSSKVVCTGSSAWFYVTRISDAKKLGDSLSLEECQQAVRASNSEVVCTGSTYWSHITRISDGKKIGESFPLQTCLQLSSGRE